MDPGRKTEVIMDLEIMLASKGRHDLEAKVYPRSRNNCVTQMMLPRKLDAKGFPQEGSNRAHHSLVGILQE